MGSGNTGGWDVPWLYENPISGIIPADAYTDVDVTFDATQVTQTGHYQATLKVSSNDPVVPTVNIPVNLWVVDEFRLYLPVILKNKGF